MITPVRPLPPTRGRLAEAAHGRAGAPLLRHVLAARARGFHFRHRQAEPGTPALCRIETGLCLAAEGRDGPAEARDLATFGPDDALPVESGRRGIWRPIAPAARVRAILDPERT